MANLLVIKGIPFRKAYNIVKDAGNKNDFSEINKLAGNEISEIDVEKCIRARKSIGSASYDEVKRMIDDRKKKSKEYRKIVEEKRKRIEDAKAITSQYCKEILDLSLNFFN